jgi:ABC-type cobalt transport system substrate-binding protein
MPLPHYSQDQTSRKGRNFEPVQQSLFEVTILPPAGVNGASMLIQQVNSISGLVINKEIGTQEQKFKFVTRSFASQPDTTALDVAINFSLNLNEANEAYVYKTLKDWYKLIYNPATGEMGLKKDYVGTIIVTQFNRVGDIFRKVTLEDCFISSGLPFLEGGDYSDAAPQAMEVTWRCDNFKEELT